MHVFLASDHGGFAYKELLKGYLATKGIEVKDMGTFAHNSDDDYPDFVLPLAQEVANSEDAVGIILGRSGNGEAIAANKVQGIRAAVCLTPEMARLARTDNHSNVLAIGADFVSIDQAYAIVNAFLTTPWGEIERHVRRVNKILAYEQRTHS